MQKRISFRRLLCAFVALISIMHSGLVSYAQDQTSLHLKAGYFAFDGYHNLSDEGVRSGYGYDLLQMISRYSNVRFSYP